jgi:hypothetical protein
MLLTVKIEMKSIVTIKITVFWNVMLCIWVDRFLQCRGTCLLDLRGMNCSF